MTDKELLLLATAQHCGEVVQLISKALSRGTYSSAAQPDLVANASLSRRLLELRGSISEVWEELRFGALP